MIGYNHIYNPTGFGRRHVVVRVGLQQVVGGRIIRASERRDADERAVAAVLAGHS